MSESPFFMTRKIVISSSASKDIANGVDYYKLQQKGLGRRFENLVHAIFKKIQRHPYAASFAYEGEGVRYKVMDTFPFIILYKFDDVNIYILRIFNTHQMPLY